MAYTIKGLAKANECESLDCYGLATLWQYWYDCHHNQHGTNNVVSDFKLLRKADRQEMLNFLASDAIWADVHTIICANIY